MCVTCSVCRSAATLRRLRYKKGPNQAQRVGDHVSIGSHITIARQLIHAIYSEGVAREVAALYGERPPPVAVYEAKKTYRAKRQSTGPAKKWWVEAMPFWAQEFELIVLHKDTTAVYKSSTPR